MRIRPATVFALSFLAAACGGEPESAVWTIPVPEGTRVNEFPAVLAGERAGQAIGLELDLVIGDQDDPNYFFFGPRDLAVDQAGLIYVLDSGNNRVQVFDVAGAYLRTVGREGQGPGELQRASRLAVAGERLVAWDDANRRLSLWSLDGEHVADSGLETNDAPSDMFGMDDGSLLIRHREMHDDFVLHQRFVKTSVDGSELVQYAQLPVTNRITVRSPTGAGSSGLFAAFFRGFSAVPSRGSAIPDFAVDRRGRLYITSSDEYQVLALTDSGSALWALRADSMRAPFPEEEVDRVVDGLGERLPELGLAKSDFTWPERLAAVARLEVDGHGHLYVFHYVHAPVDAPIAESPVDVYSSEGDRLFSGFIPEQSWRAVHGDFVYSIVTDPVTEEQLAVRFRLVEPF